MREMNRILRDSGANEIGFAFCAEVELLAMFFRPLVAKSRAEMAKRSSIYLSN
jgi:hypothetical protein